MSNPSDAGRRLTDEEKLTPDVLPLHLPVMREMAEPRDGLAPTPVWLMLLFFGLLMWGGWYLGQYSGGFLPTVFTDGPMAAGQAQAPKPPVDPMVQGQRIFNNCATCHQHDGQGVAGAYPPLAGSPYVLGDPEALARIVLFGRTGPIEVRGATYNGEMPSWIKLRDDQIASVLTYVRNSWGNSAPAVDPELVGRVRKSKQ